MGDKRICDNICLYSYEWPLPLLQGHTRESWWIGKLWYTCSWPLSWKWTHPLRGIYDSPDFSEDSAFGQLGKLKEAFFLHLLTLKRLQLKTIVIPILGF